MSRRLDMSLDDLIRTNNNNTQSRGPPNRNSRGAKGPGVNGPIHRLPSTASARSTPYPLPQMLQFEQMPPTGGMKAESGTKLYISNLGYDVSHEDLGMLFSEVGQLIDHSIHYDKSGKSKGTAEVIYFSQSDALAAIRRYNNIQLDGKAMQIHMVGADVVPSPQPTLLHTTTTSGGIFGNPRDGILGRPPPPGAFERRWNNNSNSNNNNNGGGSGRGARSGHGRVVHKDKGKVRSEDLDADLDKYHSEGLKRKEEEEYSSI